MQVGVGVWVGLWMEVGVGVGVGVGGRERTSLPTKGGRPDRKARVAAWG